MSRLILPRRKLLLGAAAALIASPAIIGRAAAQMTTMGVGGGFGAATGFTPASLSPALWIEARSSVFQSNAGTTAATANSDPVGYIGDLSGNSFHLTSAANDTTRPLLQGVGSNPYLDFDGSNDVLFRTASLDLYNSGSGYSVFICVRGNPSTDRVLVGEGNSSQTNTFVRALHSSAITASSQQATSRDDSGSNANSGVLGFLSAYDNSDHVIGITDDGAATATVRGYKDSSTETGNASYTHSGHTVTTDRHSLGAGVRTTAGNFFLGRVYGLVIVKSVISSGNRASLITYLGNLAGLSL